MTSPLLPSVRAWCAGHPSLIAGFSVCLASIGRDAAGLIRVGERTDQGATLPLHRDLGHWLSFYRNHRLVGSEMIACAHGVPAMAAMAASFERLVAEMQALPDDVADVRSPSVEACGRRMLDLFLAMEEEGRNKEPYPNLVLSAPGFLAMWFHVSVGIPCFLLFHESPQQLLRRARHGDLAALGRLLSLDGNVLSAPGVGAAIHADPGGWRLVRAALSARLPRMRPARWKVIAAASMRSAAQVCGYQLTHHAIANLYHAFAQDCDGVKEDRDLASLYGRSFERQVADTVQQGKALLRIGQKNSQLATVGGSLRQ